MALGKPAWPFHQLGMHFMLLNYYKRGSAQLVELQVPLVTGSISQRSPEGQQTNFPSTQLVGRGLL